MISLQAKEVKSCLLVSSIVTSPLISLNGELQLKPVAGYPLVSSIFAVQVALQTVDTHFSSYMMRGIPSQVSQPRTHSYARTYKQALSAGLLIYSVH